jgi:SulP family sulfate permease
MILPAIAVVLVAFSEALGVAQEFAEKHGYEVDADQELVAHGATNIVSGLAGGMIAAGGMSGSAVKEGAGARSQVTNMVAWAVTIITVLFLTPLFTSLPEAVLAALIIHAVWHLIVARKLATLRSQAPVELWFALAALLGVLLIDVLQGMIIGLLASLLFVVYRSSRSHVSSLGRVPGDTGAYSDLTWHPENTPVPGVLIVRPDDSLYYANWQSVRNSVKAMIGDMPSPPRAVIFDVSSQYEFDYTSTVGLDGLVRELKAEGIDVSFVGLHAPVLTQDKSGLLAPIFEGHTFPTLDDAVRHVEAAV